MQKEKLLAGKITNLKTQKRNKNRVNVYLDGRYAFSLAIHLAVPLHRGQELSDQEIAELEEEDEFHKAYERISKFVAHRPRSKEEVRRRLKRQEVPPHVAERVIERLSDLDHLNDAEFARLWVENRETFRPRSRRMLRYELRQKGISERIIDRALEQVNEEEGARRLAIKKGRRLSRLDWPDFRRKLLGYLTRRGFSYELAHRAVEGAWKRLVGGKDGLESEEEEWISF